MAMNDKIATYIEGLDSMLGGGIPQGIVVLIAGTPGTGKSILCMEILYKNALKGKRCLYLNLEQNDGRLERQMKQFGWDPTKVPSLKIVSVDTSNASVVDFILTEIKKSDYDIIALDSLDSISSSPAMVEELATQSFESVAQYTIPTVMDTVTIGRMKLKRIFNSIAKSKATAFVTSERVEGGQGISRDTISEFLSDGIILLTGTTIGKKLMRTIEVSKMRFTEIPGGKYDLQITKQGLAVSG